MQHQLPHELGCALRPRAPPRGGTSWPATPRRARTARRARVRPCRGCTCWHACHMAMQPVPQLLARHSARETHPAAARARRRTSHTGRGAEEQQRVVAPAVRQRVRQLRFPPWSRAWFRRGSESHDFARRVRQVFGSLARLVVVAEAQTAASTGRESAQGWSHENSGAAPPWVFTSSSSQEHAGDSRSRERRSAQARGRP